MNKTETFREAMRTLGYEASDALFDEYACLLRMTIRLGIAQDNFPTLLVRFIWDGMLQPME